MDTTHTAEDVREDDRPEPNLEELKEAMRSPLARSTALTGVLILMVFYTLYFARSLVLPIVLALLFNLLLAPLVRSLKKYFRIPEPLSAVVIVTAALAGVGYGVYQLSDPAADWVAKAPQSLREVQSKLRALREPVEQVQKAAEQVQDITTPAPGGGEETVVVQGPGLISTIVSHTQSLLANVVLVVALTYFLLASGDLFLRKLVRVLPNFSDKKRAVEIFHRVEDDVSSYLFTITLINAGLGAVTAFALYLLGMPNVVLWGVMVALMNFIPYIGAAVNLVILTLVALVTFDDIGHALLIPVTFLTLTTLEGQFITPTILGHRLTLSPVVVFVGLIFWVWMWGVVGAILAVPILAVIKIFCDSFESLAPIGEFLGR
jgi:predicted PurR-regulated permease PerM